MDANDQLLVVTGFVRGSETGPIERGAGQALAAGALRSVPVSVLKTNMERFFNQLREILAGGGDRVGDFEVSEVEVAAQITGDGQICLMGSGVKVGVQGGITFVFKRAPR